MGIRIAETDRIFPVPYGPPNHDGTPEVSFVDVKAHPEWVPTLPVCVGWPETRDLLQTINAPASPLMSLAAHQDYVSSDHTECPLSLTSFITLCYADLSRNQRSVLTTFATRLEAQLSELLQDASNDLQRTLFLNVLIELQPTSFHEQGVDGWSVTVFMAAYGGDVGDACETWGVGMTALRHIMGEPEVLG